MKRHLMLAMLAATLLAGCGDKDATQTTAPEPATASATAPSEAELMAAAEAAAKAAADPNAAPAPADTATPAPAEQALPAAAPVAGEIPGLKLGQDYEIIKNGQPFEPLNGKIEVVEVFNHVCPACAAFQPLLLSWKKRQPADVRFTYVPAAFGGNWDQFVRSYYAAQTMGIAEKAHEKVYDAIHLEETLKGERGNDSDAELGAFYAQFGVDAKQFAGNMKSFAVTGKFNKARQYIVQQQVGNTPNVMINGKYRVLGRTFEDRFRVADIIIAHERAQAAGAAAP
jgi:protein dithiol oxidoreductase (disulfide-forming)